MVLAVLPEVELELSSSPRLLNVGLPERDCVGVRSASEMLRATTSGVEYELES